jgi:hypothetical protein
LHLSVLLFSIKLYLALEIFNIRAAMIESITASAASYTAPIAASSHPVPHKDETLKSWDKIDSLVKKGAVEVDGETLDIASVVAVARLDPHYFPHIDRK